MYFYLSLIFSSFNKIYLNVYVCVDGCYHAVLCSLRYIVYSVSIFVKTIRKKICIILEMSLPDVSEEPRGGAQNPLGTRASLRAGADGG